MVPSNHRILCRPLLLLPSFFPSIRVFSNESVLHIRWPKYRSFSFSTSPSNEYSGLISFGVDWFDLVMAGLEKQERSSDWILPFSDCGGTKQRSWGRISLSRYLANVCESHGLWKPAAWQASLRASQLTWTYSRVPPIVLAYGGKVTWSRLVKI